MQNILAIIPARGNSKGIPRKNVRKLGKHPLIYYAIQTALQSKFSIDTYVSSDDSEILTLAAKFGAKTINRDDHLAEDATTLDPVIFHGFEQASKLENKHYDIVVTLQPTSPLLKSASLDAALEHLIQHPEIDTVLSATDDTHLTWTIEDGTYLPNFTKRLNRQYLKPIFRETGGFLITRDSWMSANNRIGKKVHLALLKGAEAIDIDTYEDWNICEYYLKRKKLLFVVSGYPEIGLGHVYNTLVLANEILNHDIRFLVDDKSALAAEKIGANNYPMSMQEHADITQDIAAMNPDIVINDRLDNSAAYIQTLKKQGYKVISIEDLGEGAEHADLVINAMYPEKELLPNHYFGHKYFCIRNEFVYTNPKKETPANVEQILLSFGGVDPNNFTLKVLQTIYDTCQAKNIKISVILGLGYQQQDSLKPFEGIEIHRNVSNMSKYMQRADLIFTSAGRTTFEVASIGAPTIVLCQNERESTHFFASQEYGFVNLGLGEKVSNDQLLEVFLGLVNDQNKRKYMSELMLAHDIKNGKNRVLKLINDCINE